MKTPGGHTDTIRLKRAYEEPKRGDGLRILVERLWPRGLLKKDADIEVWLKEIAPSTELRKWSAHDAERWLEFKKRYQAELRGNSDALARLVALCNRRPATFVYAAHDERHNSAVVLRAFIGRRMRLKCAALAGQTSFFESRRPTPPSACLPIWIGIVQHLDGSVTKVNCGDARGAYYRKREPRTTLRRPATNSR